jgi:hypothetical protein
MGCQSSLLQILLDPLRFAMQERHMFRGGSGESLHHDFELLKGSKELFVFLIAPGIAKSIELSRQYRLAGLDGLREILKLLGKALQGFGVGNGLGHGISPIDSGGYYNCNQ